jgi:hypothetical protein
MTKWLITKYVINRWMSNMLWCGWGGKHPNNTTQENELTVLFKNVSVNSRCVTSTTEQPCILVGTSHSIWKYSSLANELAVAVLTVPCSHWTSAPQITIHVTWNNGIWTQDELLQWISDVIKQINNCSSSQGYIFPSEMNQAVHPNCEWPFWSYVKRAVSFLLFLSFSQ